MQPSEGSIDLDTGSLDHLRPFLLHRRNEGCEFGRSGQLRTAAQIYDAGLQLRTGESLVNHTVELGYYVDRRTSRRDNALPSIGRHSVDPLLFHGRHIGKFRDALRTDYADQPELARLDERHDAGRALESHLDLSGNSVTRCRSRRLVGNKNDVGSGKDL